MTTLCISVAQLSRVVGNFAGPAPRCVPPFTARVLAYCDMGKRPKRRSSKKPRAWDIIRVSGRRGLVFWELNFFSLAFCLSVTDGRQTVREGSTKELFSNATWSIRASGRVSKDVLVHARAAEGCELTTLQHAGRLGVWTGHPRLTAHRSTKHHKGEPNCRKYGGDLGLGSG